MKAFAKKFAAGMLAAFTTPEAIKAEKFLLVTALVRFAVLVPAAAAVVDLVVKALS